MRRLAYSHLYTFGIPWHIVLRTKDGWQPPPGSSMLCVLLDVTHSETATAPIILTMGITLLTSRNWNFWHANSSRDQDDTKYMIHKDMRHGDTAWWTTIERGMYTPTS